MRLRTLWICFVLSVAVASLLPLNAQDRRVVVVNPTELKLKREAARLKICPEQLQNLRKALSDAVQLAPEVAGREPVRLADTLFRFDRNAEDVALDLIKRLESKARSSVEPQEYANFSSSARDLIRGIKRKNPVLAEKLVAEWPGQSPGVQPSEAHSSLGDFYAEMRSDPEHALRNLPSVEGGGVNYGLRSNLLRSLASNGMDSQLAQLIDQTISGARSLPVDGRSKLDDYAYFLRTVVDLLPDRADLILEGFASLFEQVESKGGTTREFTLGNGRKIPVSAGEELLLNQILNLAGHPDLMPRLVQLSPSLQQRLTDAGGLSALFYHDRVEESRRRRQLAQASPEELESLFEDSQGRSNFVDAAVRFCREDPERVETLCTAQLKRISKGSDPSRAAFELINAGRVCESCLGVLPESWQSAGQEILRRLSEADEGSEAKVPGPSDPRSRSRQSVGQNLQSFLIGSKAILEFDTALSEAHALEDKEDQFAALLAIVERLGRN